MTKTASRAIFTGALLSMSVSCGVPGGPEPSQDIVLDTLGDTVVAHVLSEGRWGSGTTLVTDLVIGGSDDDPNAIFGGLADLMAPTPEGGIVVVDWMVPQVLEYGPHGEFVRAYGRKGEGPGEYENAVVAAVGGGLIAVADAPNRKMVVYDSTGGIHAEWRFEGSASYRDAISSGRPGELVLRTDWPRERRKPSAWVPRHLVLTVLSAEGDTFQVVSAPYHDEEEYQQGYVPFQPQRLVAWHPEGFVVTGRTDVYAIELFRPQGGILRLIRDWTPVAISDDERVLYQQARDFMNTRKGGPPYYPEVPRVKPAFSRILIARTGEIWVQRHTPSVRLGPQPTDIVAAGGSRANPWKEAILFDVFQADGTFLGSVSGPTGMYAGAISGDTVWAIGLGEYDTPAVVRLIVERPGG